MPKPETRNGNKTVDAHVAACNVGLTRFLFGVWEYPFAMWLHHLLNLLASAGSIFFDAIGTTLLGRIVDVIFAVSLAVIVLHKKRREEGWRAMLNHWQQEYKAGIRFTLWCVFVIYTPVVIWSVGKAIYDDHQYFVGRAKKQVDTFRQSATIFDGTRKGLEEQISDWKAKCAGFESANGVLTNQNRDQQNTINNCQTQALKLINAHEQWKITTLSMNATSPADKNMNRAQFVILTNKTVTPVLVAVTCDQTIVNPQGSIIGATMMLDYGGKLESPRRFVFATRSPAWSPISPLLFEMDYTGKTLPECNIEAR